MTFDPEAIGSLSSLEELWLDNNELAYLPKANMMMNSSYAPVKSLANFNEVPKSQSAERRTSSAPPTETETSLWKTSLFKNMSQASDNIRKWKTQMELETKLKDRRLGEVLQTVEELRINVFELQAEKETMGRKLHEELGNRDDIVQRLTATRELCSGLKKFATHVEMRLNQCEAEKVQLSTAVQDNIEQLRELSEQFSQLSLKATDGHAELAQKILIEQAGRKDEEKEFTCLIAQLQAELCQCKEECADIEHRLATLQVECEMKDKEICSLQKEYLEKNEEFLKLSKACSEMESYIAYLSSTCDENGIKIELLTKENEELRNAVELITLEIHDKEEMLKSMEKDNSERKALITDLQATIDELQLRLCGLQTKFDETVEVTTKELADTKMHEELQLSAMKQAMDEEKIKLVDEKKMDLEKKSQELDLCKQEFEALREQHRSLKVKLDCRDDEFSRTIAQFQKLLDTCVEIDACCTEDKNKLAELLNNSLMEFDGLLLFDESLEIQLHSKEHQSTTQVKHVQFKDRLNQLQNQIEALLTSPASCLTEDQAKDYKSLNTKQEIERLSNIHHDLNGLIFEELKNVKKSLVDELKARRKLQVEYSELLQRSDSEIEQLRNEKDSGDKAVAHYKELITEAEEKLGTLKDDVETLVAENRMLRTELEDGHKENACLTTNIEKLKISLKQVEASAEQTTRKLNYQVEVEVEEKNRLQNLLNCQQADAQREINDLKKLVDQARAGKEAAENQLASSAAQLSSSLTTYKKGCDDIVSRKDREMDEERKKSTVEIENLKRKLTNLQSELNTCKMENEAMAMEARTAATFAAAVTPITKGKDVKDGGRRKEKDSQTANCKPNRVTTPLKINKKEVPGRPIPRSTPVIAAVTPTIDKRRVAPRTDKKMKVFEDETELPPVDVFESELFTPHCGILRRSNSDGRKRTVMFAASQQSDDSSASELIFVPPVKSPCYRHDGSKKKAIEKNSSKPVYKVAPVRENKLQKKSKSRDQKPVESLAWFDSDAVFGFGPED